MVAGAPITRMGLPDEVRPDGRPVPPPARMSARKRAERDDGTDDGTADQADVDTERAYHLERVINGFTPRISPEKALQLRRLLGIDDPE